MKRRTEEKRQENSTMNMKVMSIDKAARIFRVLDGRNLEPGDLENVTIAEACEYIAAATFEEFLNRNQINAIEETVR